MERDFFYGKKMPRKSRAIFSGRMLCFYGFIVLDACGFFWIGLDLDWFFVWIGFGFSFGFGLMLE